MPPSPVKLFERFYNAAVANSPVLVKNGPTSLMGYTVTNPDASATFVQLFNKADISEVTLGTTVPDDVIQIAANGQSFVSPSQIPHDYFSNGLVIAATTTANGSTANGSAARVLLKVQ